MPAISASSAPRDAVAAPTRTTGVHASQVPDPTAVARGAALSAMRCGPRVRSRVTATTAYTPTASPSASGMARGIVRSGSRTSSPSVAMRA